MASPIERTLHALHEGRLVEIRALGAVDNSGRRNTVSGYYDDYAKAAKDVDDLELHRPTGIYCTLQVIHPGLIARSPNQLTWRPDTTTSDRDVIAYQWLLLDFDPIRPAGISSTPAELKCAEVAMANADKFLDRFLHASIRLRAFSGNGYHILHGVAPDTNAEEIQRILGIVDYSIRHAGVSVDQTTYKPAQLTKLYGTTTRKGHSHGERSHRASYLL